MSAVSAARIALRISRSMSALSSSARNWQQKIASMRAGSRSHSGSASWTLLSRWWRRSRVGWYRYAPSTSTADRFRSLVMRGKQPWPAALLDGFGDGDVEPPGRAGVGQGCRGGGLDGGAGLEPGLRAGQLRGQGVDGGDAGLDARPAGVLVAGGLDGGVPQTMPNPCA